MRTSCEQLSRKDLTGKAQTVLGMVDPEKLGVTLPHEHLFIEIRGVFPEYKPDNEEEMELASQPVNMGSLWWVRRHVASNLDNMVFGDEQMAIKEALYYKNAGGNTLVDVTTDQIGRDPQALMRISEATGLNIIMGCGYYIASLHPDDMVLRSEDDIRTEIVRDITVGVRDTGIRAGIIGEIGCTEPRGDNERKALRAAAAAQNETGAPLTIHTARKPHPDLIGCMEIVRILTDSGGDMARTVMCHIERTVRESDQRRELAQTGCFLEYDIFGWEGYYSMPTVDLPNDNYRINEIMMLIDQGHLDQILISQDICFKSSLRSYGGHGYAHILRDVVPVMLAKGMTEDQIHTIMVENPRRLLQFV